MHLKYDGPRVCKVPQSEKQELIKHLKTQVKSKGLVLSGT